MLVGGGSEARWGPHFSMKSENEQVGWEPLLVPGRLNRSNGQREVKDTVSEKTIQNSVSVHLFLNPEKSLFSRLLLGRSKGFAGIAVGNPWDRNMN